MIKYENTEVWKEYRFELFFDLEKPATTLDELKQEYDKMIEKKPILKDFCTFIETVEESDIELPNSSLIFSTVIDVYDEQDPYDVFVQLYSNLYGIPCDYHEIFCHRQSLK